MEMYQSPCHNYLEPITNIMIIIPEIVLVFDHAPVGTTEASHRTFGYRGIHIWNHISQKINTNTSYPCFKKIVKIYIQNNNLDNLRLNY